jgi:hypothetical protein
MTTPIATGTALRRGELPGDDMTRSSGRHGDTKIAPTRVTKSNGSDSRHALLRPLDEDGKGNSLADAVCPGHWASAATVRSATASAPSSGVAGLSGA